VTAVDTTGVHLTGTKQRSRDTEPLGHLTVVKQSTSANNTSQWQTEKETENVQQTGDLPAPRK
jgi:hypothetical protein